MTQAPAALSKIPTESPQLASVRRPIRRLRPAKQVPGAPGSRLLAGGGERAANRGGGGVVTLDGGITVYPAHGEKGRWRAVWYEEGERRQCEAASEEKLAAKLQEVRTRLEADAPYMTRPGAALIAHFLDPDRHHVRERWSRKHTHTQTRLCALYVAPVIGALTCQDIKLAHIQQLTAGQGALAGRRPGGPRACGQRRGGVVPVGRPPARSPRATTSASSARLWRSVSMATPPSSWSTPPRTAACAGASSPR